KKANAEKKRPTIIIGKTVMGKGAVGANGESCENMVSTHGQPLSKAGVDVAATIKNLGGDPDNPFVIFPEVKELYAKRAKELEKWYAKQQKVEKKWRSKNIDLATKLDSFLSGELPEIDYSSIEVKKDVATRVASSAVLGVYGEKLDNMIVSSADLCNSDKTDGFLKKTHVIKKGDFSGKFLQMGVSELTMACIINGMALHGGVIPVCSTFFVFSDYMKPALRLAALMKTHIIYLFSHDSFRVGEDGPTHQPIEQEAQMRLMEHLRNHVGERSTVVLRPADTAETIAAWKIALEADRPAVLICSRQNIVDIPSNGNRREEAMKINKGAYVVSDCNGTPDVVLLGNGSDVATLLEGAELLTKDNVKVRVVSVPSEGLFLDQGKEYREEILPKGVFRFGLTSGLPVSLASLVGDNGYVYGLDHFGLSAPYKVLESEFGFNGETVYKEVKRFL
ncbi:MAG: transketolase, partial [Bacteroidales bacterium]|nr:transketolase [Bacteroidales bacterium]